MLTNSQGAPIAFHVTEGQKSDGPVAPDLLTAVAPSAHLLADAAYDSDALRLLLLERGSVAVIPNHPRRKTPHVFDKQAYKQRNIVERMFSHLKDWRRVATRYDKLKHTFQSAVTIAIICSWWAK